MIPFIRSLAELMAMTESRAQDNQVNYKYEAVKATEDSGQRKRYLRSKYEDQIKLPRLPKINKHKWMKSKKSVSNFFDDLDYNNQIQSSYDLTLLRRQEECNYHDVA